MKSRLTMEEFKLIHSSITVEGLDHVEGLQLSLDSGELILVKYFMEMVGFDDHAVVDDAITYMTTGRNEERNDADILNYLRALGGE